MAHYRKRIFAEVGHPIQACSVLQSTLCLRIGEHPPPPFTKHPLETMSTDDLLGVVEAAEYLGIHRTTLWRCVQAGKVPYYHGGQRGTVKMFDRESLDRLAECYLRRMGRPRKLRDTGHPSHDD